MRTGPLSTTSTDSASSTGQLFSRYQLSTFQSSKSQGLSS